MRSCLFSAIVGLVALGGLALLPATAEAHPYWNGGWGGWGAHYGGGFHDVAPHWHRTQTPFGDMWWYGRGAHDFQPHLHTHSPWGVRGHHFSPWGYTESYHPRYPFWW